MSSISQTSPPMKHKGASAILVLLVLAMSALILLTGFKLYPIYYDHWNIMSVTESFEELPELSNLSVSEMEKRFSLRLQTNSIRGFDIDESVYIEKEEGKVLIEVAYERRTNIYKNIDAIVVFDEIREFSY